MEQFPLVKSSLPVPISDSISLSRSLTKRRQVTSHHVAVTRSTRTSCTTRRNLSDQRDSTTERPFYTNPTGAYRLDAANQSRSTTSHHDRYSAVRSRPTCSTTRPSYDIGRIVLGSHACGGYLRTLASGAFQHISQ